MSPYGQRVFIPAPGGVELDAQLHEKQSTQHTGIVILHPYALLGGTMFDPVVTEVYRYAVLSPAFNCVLRYNQRGVGRSGGTKNILGWQDMGDVEAVCQYMLEKLPRASGRVFVVGYSWGACLATQALGVPGVGAYVGISFPLSGLAALLRPSRHFTALCRAEHLPRLLVAGTQDHFAKYAALLRLVEEGGGREETPPHAGHASREGFLRQPGSGAAPGVLHQSRTAGVQQYAAGAAPAHAQHGEVAAGGDVGQGECGSCATLASLNIGALRQPAAPTPQPLLLRGYPGRDHFWMEGVGEMAEGVIWWLEGMAYAD